MNIDFTEMLIDQLTDIQLPSCDVVDTDTTWITDKQCHITIDYGSVLFCFLQLYHNTGGYWREPMMEELQACAACQINDTAIELGFEELIIDKQKTTYAYTMYKKLISLVKQRDKCSEEEAVDKIMETAMQVQFASIYAMRLQFDIITKNNDYWLVGGYACVGEVDIPIIKDLRFYVNDLYKIIINGVADAFKQTNNTILK